MLEKQIVVLFLPVKDFPSKKHKFSTVIFVENLCSTILEQIIASGLSFCLWKVESTKSLPVPGMFGGNEINERKDSRIKEVVTAEIPR